jgi:hypothetical protein
LAFNHPYKEIPTSMEQERAEARYSWMKEEIDENRFVLPQVVHNFSFKFCFVQRYCFK